MKCLERFEDIILEPGDGMSELRELGFFYEIEESIRMTKKSLDWLNKERENDREAYVSFSIYHCSSSVPADMFLKARSFSQVTKEEYVAQLGVTVGNRANPIDQFTFDKAVDDALERSDMENYQTSLSQWNPQILSETLEIIKKQVSSEVSALLLCSNTR